MAFFSWTDDMSVGNTFIDQDHRKLVDMINALHDALEKGHAKNIMDKVLNNLIIYTREHFQREELEMQRIHFAGYKAHKLEHEKLLKEVSDLKQHFAAGEKINPAAVARMLSDWLRNHITGVDHLLAEAIKKAGMSA